MLDKMKLYEVTEYLGSIQYRDRDLKEIGRVIAQIIAQVNSKKTIYPADIVKFPWDDEKPVAEVTEEEIQQLAQRAEAIKTQIWPT